MTVTEKILACLLLVSLFVVINVLFFFLAKKLMFDGKNYSDLKDIEHFIEKAKSENQKGLEKAKKHLEKFSLQDQIVFLQGCCASAEDTAVFLNCEKSKIAKTMAFDNGEFSFLLLASDTFPISRKKLKAEFGKKTKLVKESELEETTGYSYGRLCPFDSNNLPVYIDRSLENFDFIYVYVGNYENIVKLTQSEIIKTTDFVKWVDVTKTKNRVD